MSETDTEHVNSAFNVSEKESLLKKWEIPISHLDYDYINKCQNDKEVERIVRILRSGEEGLFPDLLKTAEERLASLNPKSKYLRVTQSIVTKSTCDTEQWNEIAQDLENWQKQINVFDEDLQSNKNVKLKSNIPEIRKVEQQEIKKDEMTSKSSNNTRIKAWDYDAWDKYDPDVELLKEELEDEQRKKERQRKETREAFERNKKSVSFNAVENLSETEATILANREKDLGNECYRAKDYLEAYKYYSNSIKLKPTAAAYNNRCITNIKLKNYHEALEDSNQVLKREPDNIKALLRRAQIFKDLNEYSKAYDSLEELILIDPNNTFAQNLMNDIRKKIPIFEERKATSGKTSSEQSYSKLKIIEIDDKTNNKMVEKKKSKKTKNVIVPIPSTSKFRGPNVKIVEVEYSSEDSPEKVQSVSIPKKKESTNQTKSDMQEKAKIIEIDPTDENLNAQQIDKIFESQNGKENRPTVVDEVIQNSNGDSNTNDLDSSMSFEEPNDNTILNRMDEIKINSIVEDPTIPNKPTKIDKNSCGEPHPIEQVFNLITTPYEFTKAWQAISDKNDTYNRANVLRRIPTSYLSTVISNKLDGPMLTTILKCLQQHFTVANEIERVEMFLMEMPTIPRFDLISMFMDVEDKQIVKNLVVFLKQHGKILPDNIIKSFGIM